MALYSDHARYVTTITAGLLVAIPIKGRRSLTKTFKRAKDETDEILMSRAVEWRDRAWRRVIGGTVPPVTFHTQAREQSVTGVPGVTYREKVVRKGDNRYVVPCIMAVVHTVPGRNYVRPTGTRSRIFSLNKYEFNEAIALATAWRAAMIAILTANPNETPPAALAA